MSDARDGGETAPNSQALELVIGGKYRIEALLGEGGFARVYRARHARIRKLEFAIKVLKQRQLNAAEAVERFVREAEMSAALQSPYIVRLSDFGETAAGLPYIVMEFVYGVTVHDYVKKHGRMRAIEVARVAANVLRALEEAHSKGIIHRDLKPSNIMLLVEPTDGVIAKVTDFGIAKVMDDSSTGLEPSPQTTGGVVFCTPQYAGPEVLMGEPNQQSDVYALGHAMAEMLDGVSPFAGVGGFEVASLQMKPEITRFGALTRASELYTIIQRACAKQLGERYASASEMLADVDRAVEQLARRSVSLMRPMRVPDGLNPRTGSERGLREGVLADFGPEVLAGNPNAGTRPVFHASPPPPVRGEEVIVELEPLSTEVPAQGRPGAATDPKTTVAAGVHASEVRRSGTSDKHDSVDSIDLAPVETPRSAPAVSAKATGAPSAAYSGEGRLLTGSRGSGRVVLTPAAAMPAVVPPQALEVKRAYRLAVFAVALAVLVAAGSVVIVMYRPPTPTETVFLNGRPARAVARPTPTTLSVPPVDPAVLARAVLAAQARVFAARTSSPTSTEPVSTDAGELEAIRAGVVSRQLAAIVPYPLDVRVAAGRPRAAGEPVLPDQGPSPGGRPEAVPIPPDPDPLAAPPAEPRPVPPAAPERLPDPVPDRVWPPPEAVPASAGATAVSDEGNGRRRGGLRFEPRRIE
jgi:serine/threonine protein kinase